MEKSKKDFFEVFNIRPKYFYQVTNMYYIGHSHTYTIDKKDLMERFNKDRYKVTKVIKHYPTISSTTLLKLIWAATRVDDVVITHTSNFKQFKSNILKTYVHYVNSPNSMLSSEDRQTLINNVAYIFENERKKL